MKLVPDFSHAAEWDLAEITSWFDERSNSVAGRFNRAVEKTVRRLCTAPESGTLCGFRHPTYADVRMTTVSGFTNYVIFFRRRENTLEIVRMLHGAMDYEFFFD